MATKQDTFLKKFVASAIKALNTFQLSKAIAIIRLYLQHNANAAISDRVSALESTYQYMLRYFAEGKVDPDRERLYSSLREDLYGIVRAIETDAIKEESPELYYSALRKRDFYKYGFDQLLAKYDNYNSVAMLSSEQAERIKMSRLAEDTLNDIFNYVWTLPIGSEKEIRRIVDVASNPDTSFMLSSQLVAAFTLGCLRIYDREKLIALLDVDSTVGERLSAHTLVGIVLILSQHGRRLSDDYDLRLRFETWGDNLLNYRRLREVVLDMVRTVDSLTLIRKVQADVLPELLKAGPGFMNTFKNEDGVIDFAALEENPEWEEMMQKTGLNKKLRKLGNLQQEGADLMLMGVGQMKQMPFFKDVSRWFLPFDENYSEVLDGKFEGVESFAKLVTDSDLLCDSDKYSFYLMLSKIPEAQRAQMRQALSAQQEQQSEEMKEMLLKSSTPEFDREALNYIRSIYRFFEFFRLKNEFVNPFKFPFDFLSLPFVGDMMREREIIEPVAEHYLKGKNYAEALALLDILMEESNDGVLFEKAGYCLMWLNRPKEALSYFEKAELLNEQSDWLLRNVARAAEMAGDYDRAIVSLERLSEKYPEDTKYMITLARLLGNAKRYDDALKLLYKVDYLQEDASSVGLDIADILLQKGDYDKASDKYEDVCTAALLHGEQVDWPTLLRAGYAMYGKGNVREALLRWEQAMTATGSEVKEPQQIGERLRKDFKALDSEKFPLSHVGLIADSLRERIS